MKNLLNNLNVTAFTFTILLLCTSVVVHSQVSVNNSGAQPDASAMLDINSTTKGLGLPVFTDANRDAMSSPAEGLLIYNSTTEELNIHFAGVWHEISSRSFNNTQASGTSTTLGYVLVGNGTDAHHSAALDIVSNTHGLVLPNADLDSISSPTEGLMTAPGNFQFYDGSKWIEIKNSIIVNSNTTGTAPAGYVSIGSSAPLDGAAVYVESSNLGVLPPRLSSSERDAIPSPREGLFIYNEDVRRYQFWVGNIWKSVVPRFDGIFSDDDAASSKGIFSDTSTDTSVYRNAWMDRPLSPNSTPCEGGFDLTNGAGTTIVPPNFDQSGVMAMTAPAGYTGDYNWYSPNGDVFTGNPFNVSANAVYASHNGEWILRSEDNGCIDAEERVLVHIPLNPNVHNKGIFAGTSNDTSVHRNAWKDRPLSPNTTPCGRLFNLTSGAGTTIVPPNIEQSGVMTMTAPTGYTGNYNWYAPNGDVFTGNPFTIPSDSAIADYNGGWELRLEDKGCQEGGIRLTVQIPLNTNTQNSGIFSGSSNNTVVRRNAWMDDPTNPNTTPN